MSLFLIFFQLCLKKSNMNIWSKAGLSERRSWRSLGCDTLRLPCTNLGAISPYGSLWDNVYNKVNHLADKSHWQTGHFHILTVYRRSFFFVLHFLYSRGISLDGGKRSHLACIKINIKIECESIWRTGNIDSKAIWVWKCIWFAKPE